MFRRTFCVLILAAVLAEGSGLAQENPNPRTSQSEQTVVMPGMNMVDANRAATYLLTQSSGTSLQPQAWPMPMVMSRLGTWNLMWMGQAFLAATQQSGPRGGDKIYGPNWGMLGAVHELGNGSLMFRTMLSLEPATITDRVYPLLFQTGEAAFGQPIVDGQHPHDLFMELAGQYAHPLGERSMFNVYYGAIGDPALGPTAFPHRASAMEFPQAVLAHHWQDSTHIASNVLTAAFSFDKVRIEASGFHGFEPDEHRWNIDFGEMDSWSTRLSVFPSNNWKSQFSLGRLRRPEQFHGDDVVRVTASVHHVIPRGNGNSIATSFVWGRNYKTIEHEASHAVLAESVVPIGERNFLSGRFEWSQRDELFANDHDLEEQIEDQTGTHTFSVTAFTAGYTRDLLLTERAQIGVGANISTYIIDDALKPFYGDHPIGITVYLRLRVRTRQQF